MKILIFIHVEHVIKKKKFNHNIYNLPAADPQQNVVTELSFVAEDAWQLHDLLLLATVLV